MSGEVFSADSTELALRALPFGWRYRELDELLEASGLSYGIVQPGSEDPAGVPVLRVKNIRGGQILIDDVLCIDPAVEDKYQRTRLRGGEVLLSLVGSVGEAAIAPPALSGFNVARAIAVIRPSSDVSSAWLRYCLSADPAQHYMHVWKTTTVQETLNLRDVRRLPVVMPPKYEREVITAVLEALDDKITVNRQIAIAGDELASTLLEDLLVREGDIRNVSLADIALINQRKVIPSPGGRLRYIDISSVYKGYVEWPSAISWVDAPSRARRAVSPGDTIWSTVRPGRRSFALILDDDPDLVASTGFAVLTPAKVGPAFLYEVTKRDEFVQYLESVAEGSAYPAVRAERFERAIIPLPSESSLARFEAAAIVLRRSIHSAQVESRILANMRDTLLPKLMSGEIRVREAEKMMAEVT